MVVFIIQKVAFLAQALGIDIKYCFTIYVAGPYSPTLAHDYYTYQDRVATLQSDYSLSEEEAQKLVPLKRNIDLFTSISNYQLLESTATAVYLMREYPEIEDDEIIMKVRALKPYLTDELIILGMNRAKRLLFKPEYLTEKLKKEIDEWDRIDN